MNFKEEMKKRTEQIEAVLAGYLPEESGFQKTIFESMNYSVLAGGKRLRPMIMQEAYRLFGGRGKEIEPFMAAIEMIHTSSLVHDDLPAMDADEYRRGRKTTWVVYGEDMAILAGDALMIYAFETAAKAFACSADAGRVGQADRGCGADGQADDGRAAGFCLPFKDGSPFGGVDDDRRRLGRRFPGGGCGHGARGLRRGGGLPDPGRYP